MNKITTDDIAHENALLDLMMEAQDAVEHGELPYNPDSKQRLEEQAGLVGDMLFRRLFDEQ